MYTKIVSLLVLLASVTCQADHRNYVVQGSVREAGQSEWQEGESLLMQVKGLYDGTPPYWVAYESIARKNSTPVDYKSAIKGYFFKLNYEWKAGEKVDVLSLVQDSDQAPTGQRYVHSHSGLYQRYIPWIFGSALSLPFIYACAQKLGMQKESLCFGAAALWMAAAFIHGNYAKRPICQSINEYKPIVDIAHSLQMALDTGENSLSLLMYDARSMGNPCEEIVRPGFFKSYVPEPESLDCPTMSRAQLIAHSVVPTVLGLGLGTAAIKYGLPRLQY